MEIITMESTAYKNLIGKINELHLELIKLQNPVTELSNEWIDTYDVMEVLKISRRTLTKYVQKGKLKTSKIENKYFFRIRDIEQFLISNQSHR